MGEESRQWMGNESSRNFGYYQGPRSIQPHPFSQQQLGFTNFEAQSSFNNVYASQESSSGNVPHHGTLPSTLGRAYDEPRYFSNILPSVSLPTVATNQVSIPRRTDSPRASLSSPAFPTSSIVIQKRTFRQRRKDPSCDVCRERKVKCDATEGENCSECASRNIKCLFTKETNRRLSSSKHYQDLEKHLKQTKRENLKLRSMLRIAEDTDIEESPTTNVLERDTDRDASQNTKSSRKIANLGFNDTRKSILQLSQGIFARPTTQSVPYVIPVRSRDIPLLPPRNVTEKLMSAYFDNFGRYICIVDQEGLQAEKWQAYEWGTLERTGNAWIAIIFGTLAIGALFGSDLDTQGAERWNEASRFLSTAIAQINSREYDVTIEHCRAAFMISICLTELGETTSSHTWQAITLSFAMEVGLHDNSGTSMDESSSKIALWAWIDSYYRISSLELGWPLLLEYPGSPLTAHYALVNDSSQTTESVMQSGPFNNALSISCLRGLATITPHLQKAFLRPQVDRNTLRSIDFTIQSIINAFPEYLQTNSTSYLDPSLIWLTAAMNNMQLSLYRHNLSPASDMFERNFALSSCAVAARHTVNSILRSIDPERQMTQSQLDSAFAHESWCKRIRSFAPTSLIKHLWRCALILILSLDFEGARICIKTCTAIGDIRPVNNPCGRYISFFLDLMSGRISTLQQDWDQLQNDEELLAFASGDLQGNRDSAWIWDSNVKAPAGHSSMIGEQARLSISSSPPAAEYGDDWGGWSKLDTTLQALQDRQQHLRHLRGTQPIITDLQPSVRAFNSTSMAESENSDRISIANILGDAGRHQG